MQKDFSVRSNAQFLKGSRTMMAAEFWNPSSVTFTCRANKQINTALRILWEGNLYKITSINPDKFDRTLTIIGDLINE